MMLTDSKEARTTGGLAMDDPSVCSSHLRFLTKFQMLQFHALRFAKRSINPGMNETHDWNVLGLNFQCCRFSTESKFALVVIALHTVMPYLST